MEADFRGLSYWFFRLAYQKLLLALLGACALFFFCSGAWAWETNIIGTDRRGNDQGFAVALDGAGNAVAAGHTENIGTGIDFTVIKFDASGTELWRSMVNGSANGVDQAKAVAVDGAGNVAAGGITTNTGTGADFTVVKFNASGAELWRQVINGTANGFDEALAVKVDGAGNVIAAGYVANTAAGNDFTLIKFDGASGAEVWRQVINGTANGSDQANAVVVDGAGNVVAVGFTTNTGTGSDFTVIKFDGASGAELWRQVINASTISTFDQARTVAVDGLGNVLAAGDVGNRFAVVKFDGPSGTELWRYQPVFGCPSIPPSGHANTVAVDGAGNIVAGGMVTDTTFCSGPFPRRFTVVKVDGTSGGELWHRLIGGSTDNLDQARSVAVDGAGNALAAGFITNSGTLRDFTVAKFSGATGAELWRRTIDGASPVMGESFVPPSDEARAVAVDGTGNVMAVGVLQNSPDGANFGTLRDFAVIKFEGVSGVELWRQMIMGTGAWENEGYAVAVDGAGNVLTAGFTQNLDTRKDFTVAKFDRVSGAELWRQAINGTAVGYADSANAVGVDGTGDVVAAGVIENTGTGGDFTVVKFNGADGAELWRQVINGTASGFDQASAVAVDGMGDVVAAGLTYNTGTGYDFTVIKFDGASGAELWRQVINGTATSTDQALAVAVDGMGDLVAAGTFQNGFSTDFAVIKFDGASGAELWRQVITVGSARAVAVDGSGNVLAAGTVSGDFAVVKLDGASGVELWRQVINGSANGSDQVLAVAVDRTGNVIAGGFIENSGTGRDFTVIKFDGASGVELWRQVINGTATTNVHDEARAIAVDAMGDVVAAGVTVNSSTGSDFTVIKFDGTSGTEAWRRVINGSRNGSDEARAVAVDAAGDMVAAGVTRELGTFSVFTVVKLRGTDGSDFEGGGEPSPTPTVENVIWTNIVNATATGNSLQKTAGCDGCDDAGATSQQQISSGDGYVEFTASETNTARRLGLSNGSAGTGYAEIDFAIALWHNGAVSVYESGVWKTDRAAPYVSGDVFRVAVEAGVVKYYHNGTLFYTSAAAPVYPLLVDTSLFSVNATISSAVIAGRLDRGGASGADTTPPAISNVSTPVITSSGATITWTTNEPGDSQVEYGTTTAYGSLTVLNPNLVTSHAETLRGLSPDTLYHYRVRSRDAAGNLAVSGDFTFMTGPASGGTTTENVIWINVVNATATGNSLKKTSGCDGCDDAGAVSQQQITGDGYVEFTVSETDTLRYAGLSNGSSGTGYAEIDFAIAIGWGFEVRENGVYRANGPIASGDVFRIAVEAGVVKYYKNGSLLYTSAAAPVFPLVVDSSLFSLNATVSNALIAY